eukprot:COSAG06_NODE_668_length_13234_cov_75.848268_2_plen_496_part_00
MRTLTDSLTLLAVQGVGELKGEAESLSSLSHENVVQILGMAFGKTKGSDTESWMMLLEFASMDLEHMLHGSDTALRKQYTPQLMVKLIREIIAGLCYCHSAGRCHLDLKPENCLLAKDEASGTWTAKLADFGAVVSEDDKDTMEDAHLQSAKTEQWLGTYLWMPPECTGLNAEKDYPKGRVCAQPSKEATDSKFGAPDWFSFGIMLWEMVTQQLPHTGLGLATDDEGHLEQRVWVDINGKEKRDVKRGSEPAGGGEWKEDYRTVATAYYNSNRPSIPTDCPTLLSALMVACWQDRQQDRPSSSFMARLVADEDQLPVERWLEAPQPQQEPTYDSFLVGLGMEDRKVDLAEYLSKPGDELTELRQMDEQDLDDDILEDGDLGFDEEMKARFRAAVAELKQTGADPAGGQAGGAAASGAVADAKGNGGACAALEALLDLPADAHTQAMQAVEAERDTLMSERDAALSARDASVSERDAALSEVAELKARLAAFEGTP